MRILVFAPNWVGDVIFTTPVYEAIKQAYPQSYLACIVPHRCQDILVCNPYVNKLIVFDERNLHRRIRDKIRFVKALRNDGYDTVFLLHRSFTRTLLCYLAGIKKRIGYAYPKRAFLLTHRVAVIDKDAYHKQDYYLKVLEDYGIPITDKSCRVYLSPEAIQRVDNLLKEYPPQGEVRIAISPFTNWKPKDWLLDYFERLIIILRERLHGVKFFVTGRVDKEFFPSLEKEKFVVNLSGRTTLLELAALYKKMNVVVAGDSGPLHLAAAVGTPYVGIYGPTSPRLTSPRSSVRGKIIFHNDTCSVPCYVKDCNKDFICMRSVTPEEVAEEVSEILKRDD